MGSELHILDFVVFGASIVISVGIGAWYARPAAGQQTAGDVAQSMFLVKLFPQFCLCNRNGLKRKLVVHNVNDIIHNVIMNDICHDENEMMKSRNISQHE